MNNDSCKCTDGNALSDAEKGELALQITSQILARLIRADLYKDIAVHLVSIPSLALSFADALGKSIDEGGFNVSEFNQALSAFGTLTATLGLMAGMANPWVRTADTVKEFFLLVVDLADSDSNLRRLIDQIINGDDVPVNLVGDENANNLQGSNFCDTLSGMGGDDELHGGSGQDRLYGGEGHDYLFGGACDDYLDGGEGSDGLFGGEGYDTYIAGGSDNSYTGDFIIDDDGKGVVVFENIRLTGGKREVEEDNFNPNSIDGVYIGNGGTYTLSNGTLYFENAQGMVTIGEFKNGDLGIWLGTKVKEPEEPEGFPSPLILDLNGDGVTSTFIYDTKSYFDLNNDGMRERTGWVQSEDALLVLDLDHNGTIDNGSELFGNNTYLPNGTKASNGFEALAQYDENKDGIIDSSDNIYHVLQLWQDTNSNGTTDAGELHSLSELGVSSINLSYITTNVLEARNNIEQASYFEMDDGTINLVTDVWFSVDNQDTLREYNGTLSDTIAALPDFIGAGRVENLSAAMNENSGLEEAVSTLLENASSSSYDELTTQMKDILALWSGTDHIDPSQTRGEQYILNHNYSNPQAKYVYHIYAYARDVAILEAFWGEEFTMSVEGEITSDVIGTEMSVYMKDALATLSDTLLSTLLAQQLYGNDIYDVTTGSLDRSMLFVSLEDTLTNGSAEDKSMAVNLMSALIHRSGFSVLENLDSSVLSDASVQVLFEDNGVIYTLNADGSISGSYADVIEGSDGDDVITAVANGTVYGGAGDDTIYGTNGNYNYRGDTAGHEVLYGGDGNDTIMGGSGDDMLYGGAGDDTLYANGQDDYGANSYGHDVLEGGEGNDTLIGTGRNSTYIYNDGDGYDTIIDSGNVGTFSSDILELRGIRSDDVQIAIVDSDMIINILDVISSEIIGSIEIENGIYKGKIEYFVFDDQTLDFDAMNLMAQGLYKDDIYTFDRGDGIVTIKDYASIDGDTLQFGEGITADDIIIKVDANSNDLIIALKEGSKNFDELSDTITIVNWFDEDHRIENISFADGTVLYADDIISMQGTDEADSVHLLNNTDDVNLDLQAGDDTIVTADGNDIINAGAGNDSVNAGAGDDVIFGNEGNDILSGNAGSDILEGGEGADTLQGGSGNDTYIFDRGDGADIITDASGTDTLQFGAGITTDDLIIKVDNNDLIVALKEDGVAFEELSDTIMITNWLNENYRIENFEFSDGTILGVNDIMSTQATENNDLFRPLDMNDSFSVHMLGGDDYVIGSNVDDVIYGGEGNDIINGGFGDDTLLGGTGNDTLNGNEGNDIIEGGAGDDTLDGALGDDTYIFNRGDGADIIKDVGVYKPYYYLSYTKIINGGTDTLQFGEGITVEDIIIKASSDSNNLIVAINEDGKSFDQLSDTITLTNWFNENYRIESITFEDGTVWSVADIINAQGTDEADTVHLLNSTDDVNLNLGAGDDVIVTANGNDTIDAGEGNDAINTGMGDDTIIGGLGDDTINAGEGNDTINAGAGDDTINAGAGNDTIQGGVGNDTLQGGEGDDTYIFNRGDGADRIQEHEYYLSGINDVDTLQFGEGITTDNIIVKADADNNDLILAIKEDGVAFEELSDTITIKYWFGENYRIENFAFEDGTVLDVNAILELQLTDDSDNYLRYLDGENTINAQGGNDIIEGGIGNDTYIFERGDGQDVINDPAGINVLAFGTGITQDDLEIRADNNYMIIALKEDGVAFDMLSDKIYFTKVGIGDYGLTSIVLSDGSSIDPNALIASYEGTEGDDVIDLAYLQAINSSVQADDSIIVNANGGSDTVILGNGANIVNMGEGNNESLSLGNGNNQIDTGEGSNKSISAGDGDNTIVLSSSVTTLNMGNGNNALYVHTEGDREIDAVFGDGSNTVIDTINSVEHTVDYSMEFGSGDNLVQIAEQSSQESGEYKINRDITIDAGDGANEILINNGDGTTLINAGSGDNSIRFSADVDDVNIILGDGSNAIEQTEDEDIDYVDYAWVYDETSGEWYITDEIVDTFSYSNTIRMNLGNGTNNITLSDTAQDYQLNLGDGNNNLIIGKVGSDNDYAMQSYIDIGAGDNTITVNSGDGSLGIYTGEGNNAISFSADIDDVGIFVGNGNNIITQIAAEDTDGDDDPIIVIAREEPIIGGNNGYLVDNTTSIEIGLGSNTITLGASDDTVYFSYDVVESLLGGASSLSNTIDVGAGSNYIDLKESSVDQIISVGASNYNELSSYEGYDYNEIYLGSGNNTVNIKGSDEVYLEALDGNNQIVLDDTEYSELVLGSGNNNMNISNVNEVYFEASEDDGNNSFIIDNSEFVTIYGSNTNTISLQNGSTFLDVHDASSNTIALGSGNDEIYTSGSNDIYKVEKGNGNDLILDMEGLDKIVFGEGISTADLKVFVQLGSTLANNEIHPDAIDNFTYALEEDDYADYPLDYVNVVIQYSTDPNDVITLVNWYDEASRIEQFEFSDGTLLSDHEIVALIDASENDIIAGTEGNNTLDNAAGDDVLVGFEGNDVYSFNRGDSHDIIIEDSGFDVIMFGEGIAKDDLILEQVDSDLVISLKVDGAITSEYADTITIQDWLDTSLEHTIERFIFSDGSTMELSEMLELVGAEMITYYGTPEEDTLIGTDDSDIILARASDDVIQGGAGNDILFGEEGNDTLIGGEGYDTLYGGEGDDIYEIDRNMGDDCIIDVQGNDTLQFASGITSEDISIEYENDDLIVSLEGTSVLIANWYASDDRIETFTFADGTSMSVDDIVNHQTYDKKGTEEGTSFTIDAIQDTIYRGQEGDDSYLIDKNLGESTIIDAGGKDTIEFAAGITPEDISLAYEGDDLIISLEGTIVRIEGWYTLEDRIETFVFEDGTTFDAQGIIDLTATSESDAIRSLEEGSTIDAKDGDDILESSSGNDTLLGGNGNDIYIIDNFAGQDVIDDTDGANVIQMGNGITPDMLRITWVQGSDDIYIYNNGDEANGITIKDWYTVPDKEIVFADGTVWDSEAILDAMGSEFDDIYNGFKDQDNVIYAKGGDDIISTFDHNDTLYGGSGDDMLDGGAGDDILVGGTGNDVLLGNSGDDTYIFEKGFGRDTIYDSVFDGTDGGNNRIVFGEGINYDDLIVKTFEGDDNLYIAISETGKSFNELEDVITIRDWYLENNRIEEIIFDDGTEITIPELVRSKAIDNGDAIAALSEGGILEGTEGDDTLIGNIGEDFILGLGGNDVLIGNEGNDVLIGGEGNDVLKGGAGDDIYFFDRGEGQDIIYDNTTAIQEQYGYVADENGVERWSKIDYVYNIDAGTDTLYFGEGITPEDLIVTNDGYDLVITLKDSPEDELRIQDYYKEENAIEYFGFSDGTIMSGSEMEALLFTENDDTVTFVDYQDHVLNGDDGDDVITGGNGNDTIDGEAGNDTLNGGFGDDVYVFGRGSGHDTIIDSGEGEWWQSQSGSDTLLFKDGIDSDDLIIRQSGNDIIIGLKEDGKTFDELQDTLRIVGALDATNLFESIAFESTGESQDIAALLQNTAPIASDTTVEVIEDTLYEGTLPQATDVDSDTLTYTLKTQPLNGTVVVNEDGTYSYTPNENFYGQESFTYEVSDGELVSEATITLNVAPVNDAPIASDATVEAIEDTLYEGTLPQATDVDSDTLTYTLKTQPLNGTVVVNEDGTYSYTPNENFYGEESFVYEVSDGELVSEATVTLNVAPVNDAPIASDATVEAIEDTLYEGTLPQATDVDSDTLTYTLKTQPLNGTVVVNEDGTYSYTPNENFYGQESFVYEVSDGELISEATVTLNVAPVNDAPIASDATVEAIEDTLYEGTLPQATDVDSDTLTYTLKTQPLNGTVVVNEDGTYSYTPNENFYGKESFVYEVSDGELTSEATVTINVANVRDDLTIYGNNHNNILIGDGIDSGSYDTIYGFNGKDILKGLEGNDTLYGGNGNDTLYGGSGDDILDGGRGFDRMYGGSGDDIVYMDNSWLEYADGGAGNDTLSFAYSNHGVMTSVSGSAFGFLHCFGKGAINFENLEGSKYSDTLFGDNGDNSIYGNSGNDTIYGDKGNDILYGEEGRDTLFGGAGEDIFVFDTELSISNIDRIMDFSSDDDMIYLDNEIFSKLIEEGALSADNFTSNVSGQAQDSDDYIIYESDTGKLFYDGDGNGSEAAILIAQLGHGWSWSAPTITHEDIVVI